MIDIEAIVRIARGRGISLSEAAKEMLSYDVQRGWTGTKLWMGVKRCDTCRHMRHVMFTAGVGLRCTEIGLVEEEAARINTNGLCNRWKG
jgi:DMSO/TMAO reductase YedYZ molybdopterin-dependent catalytic subunit